MHSSNKKEQEALTIAAALQKLRAEEPLFNITAGVPDARPVRRRRVSRCQQPLLGLFGGRLAGAGSWNRTGT